MTDSNMSAYFISGFFFQNQQLLGIDIGPYGSMAVIKGGLYHFPFFGVIHQDEQGFSDDLVGAMSDQLGESQLLDIVISVGKNARED